MKMVQCKVCSKLKIFVLFLDSKYGTQCANCKSSIYLQEPLIFFTCLDIRLTLYVFLYLFFFRLCYFLGLFVCLFPHSLNLIIVILGGKMGFFLSNFVIVERLCPT
jgi:hypothetical protein